MKKIISLLIVMIMALSFIFSNGVSAETQLLGDTNGDKVIDNKDVVTLFRHVSGTSTDAVKENCDVNSDKEIDNKDVVMIFRYVSENWAHFHQYGEWTIIKEATCTEPGKREHTCIYGEKETQTIIAPGHSFSEWKTVEEATCTKDGRQERLCSNCGFKETQTISSRGGHSFSEWKTVKNVSCTEAGLQERLCSVCGEKETKEIENKGHSFSSWITEKTPACTAEGRKTRKCTVCGTIETEQIPALGHDYKDGFCKRCGEEYHITVILPKSPITVVYHFQETSAELSSLSYSFDEYGNLKISYTIKKTYDREGSSGTNSLRFGYKLLDSDGYVLYTGSSSCYGLQVGDIKKNEYFYIYKRDFENVSSSTLTLVIVDV